jgi:hypothetical protein
MDRGSSGIWRGVPVIISFAFIIILKGGGAATNTLSVFEVRSIR